MKLKNTCLLSILLYWFLSISYSQNSKSVFSLNGEAEFEQTETAFPPNKYSRKISVPGLIDLAKPKIDQYEQYFLGTYKPRYSWYRFKFSLDKAMENKYAVLRLLKSSFNTQIIINGHDVGTYMQCNTPIEAELTDFLEFEKENILLVRVGDRAWIPKEAATGFDREKFTDIPGIWDDIFISFTGPIKINRALILPNFAESKVTAKIKLENLANMVDRDMELSRIEFTVSTYLREKATKKKVSAEYINNGVLQCLQEHQLEFDLPLSDVKAWSPDSPFLYEAVISVRADSLHFSNYGNHQIKKSFQQYSWFGNSDEEIIAFGMRDFRPNGRILELNGKEFHLFGSTLTLNRFMEDRERADLPWNKEWVKKLMIDIPKSMGWNTFRVSLGLLPSFWYDLADEYGIIIQNEYPMWNLRGRNIQIMKEYTDWVWTDGNHPSIVVWDALNENVQPFIGNELLPRLKQLDPTRIWDAGWMGLDKNNKVEMQEIHWYTLGHGWWSSNEYVEKQRTNYRFGNLFTNVGSLDTYTKIDVPLILNEYGWLWLNRDGEHSAIRTYGKFSDRDKTPYKTNYEYYETDGTQLYDQRDVYDYYLGKNTTANNKWDFQAYLLGIETEMLRSTRLFSGVISFPYLTNNGGYTGDWFKGRIKDLEPTEGLLVQYHSMKPFAAFIDEEDGRYQKNPKYFEPGSLQSINLFTVNDLDIKKSGTIKLELINTEGTTVMKQEIPVAVERYWQKLISTVITMPLVEGGYMLIAELDDIDNENIPQISRRYIKIGKKDAIKFPEYHYKRPDNFPK